MSEQLSKKQVKKLLYLATYASVSTAVLLILVKFAAWFFTGSLSVLASLVDSLMDAAVSMINLLAVRYSLKSADQEHRFGHGKAEYLAGLGQATFIICSALFLILNAIKRIITPHPLEAATTGIAIMTFAILATIILLLIQRHVVKRTQSTAIKADSVHYASDLFTNIGTIGALFLTACGWPWLDPVIALCISLYIVYSAGKIGYESVQMLMDHELPEDTLKTICDIALSHPKVIGVHDLRTRQSGQIKIIQLHLELDDAIPLIQAHAIAKDVESAIKTVLPGSDVTIHQDPISSHASRLPDNKGCLLEKK